MAVRAELSVEGINPFDREGERLLPPENFLYRS